VSTGGHFSSPPIQDHKDAALRAISVLVALFILWVQDRIVHAKDESERKAKKSQAYGPEHFVYRHLDSLVPWFISSATYSFTRQAAT
jgi:hypothetical protein